MHLFVAKQLQVATKPENDGCALILPRALLQKRLLVGLFGTSTHCHTRCTGAQRRDRLKHCTTCQQLGCARLVIGQFALFNTMLYFLGAQRWIAFLVLPCQV